MFMDMFEKLPVRIQGYIALMLGVILILGALGRLGIIQNILEMLLILTGLFIFFWGMKKSEVYTQLKAIISKK